MTQPPKPDDEKPESPKPSTALQRRIVETLEAPRPVDDDDDERGYLARAIVLTGLPYRRVIGQEHVRVNGDFMFHIQTPSIIGPVPYGIYPRLLLPWIGKEAKRKGRVIELGDSLSQFMYELGLEGPSGGRWGSITRFKEQALSLFGSTITTVYKPDDAPKDTRQFLLADSSTTWWNAKDPTQAGLWRSTVTLSERFYREIIEHGVPLRFSTLKELKRHGPLTLDVYAWLSYRTYRLSNGGRPGKPIKWGSLAKQFGRSRHPRQFKAAFIEALANILPHYDGARFEIQPEGLLLKQGYPHIVPRALDV